MATTKINKYYDSEGDILYIDFKPAASAKGIQLTQNILLRVDGATGNALGLAIHNYTKIAAQGLVDSLTGLPSTDNQIVLQALNSKPLNEFLLLQRGTITLGPALLPQEAKAT
jgi:uncharacterized protein YuzE